MKTVLEFLPNNVFFIDGMSTIAGDVTASYSGVVVTELADYEEYDSTASTSPGITLERLKYAILINLPI